jgi:hypothetical protein
LQQTLLPEDPEQKPERQPSLFVHANPFAAWPQLPETQWWPWAHTLSLVQSPL